ncbi:hypothetical protein TorRG33x02_028260 [Trema orientale]|uniref:RNase H type-1 domain-containing protein n=1 Tax=Trema orientale TaxID=63057 RepID=A0A2P5FUQ3_TREOI|nr:hypothetical protein TorRG33x02_028260 [Trema orientale]
MNIDATFASETGVVSFGIVIRNATGVVLYFAVGPLLFGAYIVLHAELLGIREGLLLTQADGFTVQVVENDSLITSRTSHHSATVNSWEDAIIFDIVSLLPLVKVVYAAMYLN